MLKVTRKATAIRAEWLRLGWRLYATNAPKEALSLAQAAHVYRDAPLIERNYARLKGKALRIRPLYVQREDHLIGMVRLLSLALRVLTIVEYVVRRRLTRLGKSLKGLHAGNPNRQTQCPTTERLLKAFDGITLTQLSSASESCTRLTPLSPLQEQILRLLGFPKQLYPRLETGIRSTATRNQEGNMQQD